jgi:hypothetical protein
MKKLVFLLALSCTLVGCSDTYRYPCQDPANKDKAECNLPACEADGFCYDKLNGLQQETVVIEEQQPCNSETTETTSEEIGE